MNKTSQRILAVGLPLATVAVTGVAFAAWTATGSGNGAAKSQAIKTVDVSSTVGTGDLYPDSTGALAVTVTNNAPYSVQLGTIVPKAATSLLPANCALTYNFTSKDVSTYVLGPGDSQDFIIANGVKMGATSVDGCANAPFDIPVTVSAASVAAATPESHSTVATL